MRGQWVPCTQNPKASQWAPEIRSHNTCNGYPYLKIPRRHKVGGPPTLPWALPCTGFHSIAVPTLHPSGVGGPPTLPWALLVTQNPKAYPVLKIPRHTLYSKSQGVPCTSKSQGVPESKNPKASQWATEIRSHNTCNGYQKSDLTIRVMGGARAPIQWESYVRPLAMSKDSLFFSPHILYDPVLSA